MDVNCTNCAVKGKTYINYVNTKSFLIHVIRNVINEFSFREIVSLYTWHHLGIGMLHNQMSNIVYVEIRICSFCILLL